jgi:hypothetical protein
MVPTCPRRSPFSGSSWVSATTSNSFMSESPQNVAARQARKVLIYKHDPSGTHQRSASCMLQRKIYHITMTESVNFTGNGFLLAGRRLQPLLQHRAIGRADSQHRSKDARLMATFGVSRTQTIIAQFRDFDQRFLATRQLHGSSSLASSKLHRNKEATMLRARPRATGMPVALTRLSRSLASCALAATRKSGAALGSVERAGALKCCSHGDRTT